MKKKYLFHDTNYRNKGIKINIKKYLAFRNRMLMNDKRIRNREYRRIKPGMEVYVSEKNNGSYNLAIYVVEKRNSKIYGYVTNCFKDKTKIDTYCSVRLNSQNIRFEIRK